MTTETWCNQIMGVNCKQLEASIMTIFQLGSNNQWKKGLQWLDQTRQDFSEFSKDFFK